MNRHLVLIVLGILTSAAIVSRRALSFTTARSSRSTRGSERWRPWPFSTVGSCRSAPMPDVFKVAGPDTERIDLAHLARVDRARAPVGTFSRM